MKTTPFYARLARNWGFLTCSLFFLSMLIFNASCKSKMQAKGMTQNMTQYILAYTSGTISRESPVRVRFTAPVIRQEDVGTAINSALFSLSPAVKGATVWEDVQTLRFIPETAFESNQSFVGSVELGKLFKNAPADAQEFQFDFRTRALSFKLEIDGVETENSGDPSKITLNGALVSSDNLSDKNLTTIFETALKVSQNGNNLTVLWVHSADGRQHSFKIRNIQRTDKASELTLAWKNSPDETIQTRTQKLTIPSLGDFGVLATQAGGDENVFIKVCFSDPLSSTQDLKGLLKIDGDANNLRWAVDGSNLLIYPNANVGISPNIFLDAAIQNAKGRTLNAPYNEKISLSGAKPALKLVGRGVIMPNSNQLNFPFEAINLNYVDVEIVKIFNNNIVEFLKSNDMDNSNDLERVGKIILQKRLSLKELSTSYDPQKWVRYGLNLSELIKQDPRSIYQVRLGFRRNYANSVCNDASSEKALEGLTLAESALFSNPKNNNPADFDSNWEQQQSIFRYDYNGGEGEQPYESGSFENPCKPQFYNRDNFVRRNVFASDLGIVAKRGGDGALFVIVSDLKTMAARSGVKLELLNLQNQVVASGSTSSDGTVVLNNFTDKPWLIVATSGKEQGYLALGNTTNLNLSRFDVAGTQTMNGMKGFLYGERGVWRPGDSLHLNFILEDKEKKLPANYPVSLELFDPQGNLYLRTAAFEAIGDIYPFHIATRGDAPTGNWRCDVKAGGATFSERLKIETVKPNRLRIGLDFGKKEFSASEAQLNGKLKVGWLHGAPARNVKVKIDATLTGAKTEFSKYPNFIFDSPVRSIKADPIVLFDGNVDENGNRDIAATLPSAKEAAGKVNIGLKIRAFEPSGDFSSDFQTLSYFPFNTMVGISIPKNKNEEKRFDIGKKAQFKFAMVDKNGSPQAQRAVMVKVMRTEWRWWWETGEDDEAQFAAAKGMKTIAEFQLTTQADGTVSGEVEVPEWGRYLVYVTDLFSGHATGDYFYSGYPWNDSENADLSRQDAAMLSFKATKEKYNVGEMVEINIPTPEGGKALVSLENGTKVVQAKWVATHNGKTTYTFRATPEMSPTIYAFVTLIQPHENSKSDVPLRMYGVTPVQIEDPQSRLEPTISMPEVVKPEEKITVEVREKRGKPMSYTLAVVDEGLLDLTRFKTPDPWERFYAREALGVQTFDLYDQVLGSYGGTLDRILNIGGDGAARQKNAQRANRFKPVVLTLGPFYSKGGTARHTLTIPNYVGSVRVMVVSSNKGAYGCSEKTVPVRKPLMVLATLPRVLSPKETLKLPVNVFALENKVKSVTVKIEETSGLVRFTGNTTRTLNFEKTPDDKIIDFDAICSDGVGVAKFLVTAEGGGERSTQEIEVQVRNPNLQLTQVKDALVQSNQQAQIPFTPLGNNGIQTVTLEVSAMPPLDLANRLNYLLQYPHGCLEQTTSGAFPQLYVHQVLNLDEKQRGLANANVRVALDKLRIFQNSMGGFSYWQGEIQSDLWATNYVGHFLVEAKNMGYQLPPAMLDRWLKFQKSAAKQWTGARTEGWTEATTELTQAYRLYTLALAGSAELPAMNGLREKQNLSNLARWRLAAAYALVGKNDIAKQLLAQANTQVNPYRELGYTFGSELRDKAMILETQILLNDMQNATSTAREVANQLGSADWYATQSVAFGLMSMSKFVGKNNVANNFSFAYSVNGSAAVNVKSTTPIVQISLPASKANTLTFKNLHGSQLFARVVSRGQPSVDDKLVGAQNSNLNMKVTYKTLKGEPVNIASLKQGTDFIAEVSINNPGNLGKMYKEMALTQIFPSGWEILNSRLNPNQSANATLSNLRYQDVRDDRVSSYFDLPAGKTYVYKVQLNAAYVGRFYLPTQVCEAMYDVSIGAKQPGAWVQVLAGNDKMPM
jgi:alpha-2-macroglobulin